MLPKVAEQCLMSGFTPDPQERRHGILTMRFDVQLGRQEL